MSQTNHLMQNMTQLGLSESIYIPGVNDRPLAGGQTGIGTQVIHLDAATPLVLPPLVCVVIATPKMYDNLPYMKYAIKNMIECHSKSITGVSPAYTSDVDETQIGHDGQSFQYTTGTKREAVSPSYTLQELAGNPFFNIIRQWMFNKHNPDTGFSFVGLEGTHHPISSTTTMMCAYIQYDITGRPDNILDGWVISNQAPTGTGELGSERNLGEFKGMERSFDFTGYLHHDRFTQDLCYRIADKLQVHTIDYWNKGQAPFGVTEQTAALSDLGIEAAIKDFQED